MSNKTLKCICINVNSIISKHKRHYFNLFLIEHKPDVVLIAEHRLSKKHNVNFKGYNMILQTDKAENYRKNINQGTATAICMKEKYKYDIINLPETKNLGKIAIKISLTNGEEITFVALYNRPNLLRSDLDKVIFSISSDQFVLGGDLNARHPNWGDKETNNNGRSLCSWLSECPRAKLIPTKFATRISKHCQWFLDIFLVSPTVDISFEEGSGYIESLKTHQFESDHSAVELNIIKNHNVLSCEATEVYSYGKMNKEKFNNTLNAGLNCINLSNNKNMNKLEIDRVRLRLHWRN